MNDQGNKEIKSIVLSYVFNSPTLVPWKVVAPHQDSFEDAIEAILLWQEAGHRETNRFKEGDLICEQNNPFLKMTVRRILRQSVKDESTGETKKRLLGIETYWFVKPDEALMQLLSMSTRGRKVPGAQLAEIEQT